MTTFVRSTLERAAKTFVQAFLAFYLASAGLGDTNAALNDPGAWDLLWRLDNVKVGAVAAVLSVLASIVSRPIGPDSASLVVDETSSADSPAHA